MDVSIYAARLIAKQIFVGNVQNWARPFFFTRKSGESSRHPQHGLKRDEPPTGYWSPSGNPSCLSVHSGQGAKLFLDLC